MQITRLDIANFRIIRSASLVLEDGVWAIIGPNGAGKSSLVEAIVWALYGHQAARSGKEEIKRQMAAPDETCRVRLEFVVGGVGYELTRQLVGPRQRHEVTLAADGTTAAVGVTDTQREIVSVLGLTLQGFLTSFMARQQELNTLSDIAPAKRRDHLAAMLGVEQLDQAIIRAKGDNRVYAGQVATLESHLAGLGDIESRLAEASERLGKLTSLTPGFEQESRESREALAGATEALSLWQQKHTEWIDLKARHNATAERVEALERDCRRLDGEITQLRQDEEVGRKMRLQLDRLKNVPDQLEQVKEGRRRLQLKRQAETRRATVADELKRLNQERTTHVSALAEIESRLSKLPPDLDGRLKEARERVECLRQEYSECKGENLAVDRELANLQSQIARAADLGPDSVCDRCRRPFGQDLKSIREHLTREEAALIARQRDISGALKEKEELGLRAKGKLDDLTNMLEQQRQEQRSLELGQANLENLKRQLKALADESDNLDNELKQIGAAEYDPEAEAELSRQADTLKKLSVEAATLDGRLQRLPGAKEELTRLRTELATVQKQATALTRELADLGFDQKKYEGATQRYNEARQRHDEARAELARHQKDAELAQAAVDELLRARESRSKAESDLEARREDQYYGEKLVTLLSGYRQQVVSSIRPRLGHLSAGLFDEMTGGKYNLVELDDKYNLRILDNGEFFGVERFSGGEKDLANLCLRLSISLALTESAGLDHSFIILDEVFGSQDEERQELVIDSLRGLLQRFPQVLLVTHIEDIKDRVGRLIQVAPTGQGYSEVIVDGRTV